MSKQLPRQLSLVQGFSVWLLLYQLSGKLHGSAPMKQQHQSLNFKSLNIIALTNRWLAASQSEVTLITSAKEVMFLSDFVCLFVCLCVSKITQEVMNGSF